MIEHKVETAKKKNNKKSKATKFIPVYRFLKRCVKKFSNYARHSSTFDHFADRMLYF